MKWLIVLLFSIISFNLLAAEVGEDKKGECQFAVQSAKRDAKVVSHEVNAEQAEKEVKTLSK